MRDVGRLLTAAALGAMLLAGCGDLSVGESPDSGSTTTSSSAPAGDPAATGTDVPPPPGAAPPGPPCTEQQDYAGDPRPPEEINRLGAESGECPAPLPPPPGAPGDPAASPGPGAPAPGEPLPPGAAPPPGPGGPVPPPGRPGDPGFNGEQACNDRFWRQHMQAEGDAICGSNAWAQGFFN